MGCIYCKVCKKYVDKIFIVAAYDVIKMATRITVQCHGETYILIVDDVDRGKDLYIPQEQNI